MYTEISSLDLQKAVELLRNGKLVAFPTETVYGLGADAMNVNAVKKIFTAKKRPADHPVIVHIENAEQLSNWACNIPSSAFALAKKFWPGPMTLILERAPHVSDIITGGQPTIGLRIPQHPIAQNLLHLFGSGIAAPSANSFGRLSPTLAKHVAEELGTAVNFILDGGACTLGIESTIIDLSSETPRILRPGSLALTEINSVLGGCLSSQPTSSSAPRAPGALPSHYAPKTPLRIIAPAKLKKFLADSDQKPIAVLTQNEIFSENNNIRWILMPKDPIQYAHDLYAKLRSVDDGSYSMIVVTTVPQNEEWTAILDRLTKAQGR